MSWSPEPKPGKQPTISVGRGQSFTYQGKCYTNLAVDEKHFSPDDLAKAWGVSAQTIRNVFEDEPDVLRLGNSSARKRSYSMSVSVFLTLWQCVFTAGCPRFQHDYMAQTRSTMLERRPQRPPLWLPDSLRSPNQRQASSRDSKNHELAKGIGRCSTQRDRGLPRHTEVTVDRAGLRRCTSSGCYSAR